MKPYFIALPSGNFINLAWACEIQADPTHPPPLAVILWANGVESTTLRGDDAMAVIEAIEQIAYKRSALDQMPFFRHHPDNR